MTGSRERALDVGCPTCGVDIGVACNGKNRPRVSVHRDRITAARAIVGLDSRSAQPRVNRRDTPGTVYIIEGAPGLYKIGFTAGPIGKRLRALQTGNPTKLRTEMTITGTARDEQRLHALFSDKRTVGEWFELSALDLAVLRAGG